MKQEKLARLSGKLGYQFKSYHFLQQAITHRSAALQNNERLEFLGDSILSIVIAEALFIKFPTEKEGSLSRLRANLVKGDTLAKIAKDLDLGDFLVLGGGELKSGGFRRASILADALEAIFAAIYLDSNFETAKKVILTLYAARLDNICLQAEQKDYKTRLQELLQSNKHPLPIYILKHTGGTPQEPEFHIECQHEILEKPIAGYGSTRRQAEQSAAKQMLNYLQNK